MIDKVNQTGQAANVSPVRRTQRRSGAQGGAFGALLHERIEDKQAEDRRIDFSKHALARAEQRGIELTPDLMDKLAGSVEKAQEKGANNILAFNAQQAFIINVPYGRVITTMTQDEMKENVFTNIDGAVLL